MGKSVLQSVLRGGLGFGAGGVLAAILMAAAMSTPMLHLPRLAFFLMLGAYFSGGAVGAAAMTWGWCERPEITRAAIGFGGGFTVAGLAALFVSISIQGGGKPEVLYGVVGFGLPYAIAGAAGAAFISIRYALPGAIAFGVGGAWGGYLLFTAAGHASALIPAAALGGLLSPHLLGGALFGAIVAFLDASE